MAPVTHRAGDTLHVCPGPRGAVSSLCLTICQERYTLVLWSIWTEIGAVQCELRIADRREE